MERIEIRGRTPGMPLPSRVNWPGTVLVLMIILLGIGFAGTNDYIEELEVERDNLRVKVSRYEAACVTPSNFAEAHP